MVLRKWWATRWYFVLVAVVQVLSALRLFAVSASSNSRTFTLSGAPIKIVGFCILRTIAGNLTISIETDGIEVTRFNKGILHRAFLQIAFESMPAATVMKMITCAEDVNITLFRSNIFTRFVVEALYRMTVRTKGPLEIVRFLRLGKCDDDLHVTPTSQVDRFAQNTLVHFRHLIDLAAEAEVSSPLPPTDSLLISFIVPVYNTDVRFLDDLFRSFQMQPSGFSELIFSDDASTFAATRAWLLTHTNDKGVRVVFNPTNCGIASTTNAGIAVSAGCWIGLLDHDDALTPFAVGRIARALVENPECQFLYTDEMLSDETLVPIDYFLKPAWDPVLLSGVNYVNHLSLYKRERLLEIGLLRSEFDGSQDYELLLRYTTHLRRSEVVHLPYPAYIWRRSKNTYSTRFLSQATSNARRAIEQSYGHPLPVVVGEAVSPDLHRIRFDQGMQHWPLVSIVLPNKDTPELIRRVLQGVFERTDYPNFEVIVIDNGTTDQETLSIYEMYANKMSNFMFDINEGEFNFSRSINRGIGFSRGEFVLLLNNDIEVEDELWLKEMVSCFEFGNVGIVGAKLLYPTRKLQHAGVIAGFGGYAGHWFIGFDDKYPGPMGRLWVRQQFSCVTGACMLVARSCIDAVGLLDEDNFAVAYNDIDYCLRATKAGFQVIWTPFASLVHHESTSRGSDEAPQNTERFEREKANLQRLHGTDALEDPTINPWYSRGYSAPRPICRNTLPKARRR